MASPSARLTFRIVTGAARLGVLYLATHALGTWLGWRVLADAETPEPTAVADEDETDDEDEPETRAKTAPKGPTPTKASDPRESRITKYNVFCPTCAPAEAVDEPLPVPTGVGVDEEALEFPGAVHSTLPLALVATMEAEAPGISLATISKQEGSTSVYAEGEEVMDGVTLLAVDLGLVYLRTATRVEYLRLSDELAPPPAPPTPEEEEPKEEPKKSKYELDGAADAIQCQGLSCTVERRFVEQLLANPAQLASQAMARPFSRDGVEGFRLSRVRKGTVPHLLGLRSSDVITGINGNELGSLDGAMALYAKLRTASHLSVDFVHSEGGQRQALRLDITIQ